MAVCLEVRLKEENYQEWMRMESKIAWRIQPIYIHRTCQDASKGAGRTG